MVRLAHRYGRSCSVTAHAYDIFRSDILRRGIAAPVLTGVDVVITPSHYNKRYIHQNFKIPLGKIHVVRASIFLTEDATIGVQNDVVSAGRLIEKKGFVTLLESMASLQASHPIKLKTLIIGDGEDMRDLKDFARKLGIEDTVEFAGELTNEETIARIGSSRIFVLPCCFAADGDVDVCPLVIQEAMAIGVTVVSTNIASIPELVEDGISGLLVPPSSPVELAQAIKRLLDNSELMATLSNNAKKKIKQDFDVEHQTAELVSIWQKELGLTKHD
ncbi:hypothetical protein GCM10007053_18540 [Halioglobus pacificus]|uniref:Glycosyl transferase family 1 domain-containing protein n=2 Tax=Parahalioglobus pacificus TaxID=930806 RepID=A0A918XIG2_9GAMM|nr:hypothetical protein GCM10007053_18540 [Halioglobus pacificus]